MRRAVTLTWFTPNVSTGSRQTPHAKAPNPIFPENFLDQVYQNPNQTLDLSWWQPTSVTRFLAWSNHTQEPGGSHYFEDWLIDLDTATFYITRWDT